MKPLKHHTLINRNDNTAVGIVYGIDDQGQFQFAALQNHVIRFGSATLKEMHDNGYNILLSIELHKKMFEEMREHAGLPDGFETIEDVEYIND